MRACLWATYYLGNQDSFTSSLTQQPISFQCPDCHGCSFRSRPASDPDLEGTLKSSDPAVKALRIALGHLFYSAFSSQLLQLLQAWGNSEGRNAHPENSVFKRTLCLFLSDSKLQPLLASGGNMGCQSEAAMVTLAFDDGTTPANPWVSTFSLTTAELVGRRAIPLETMQILGLSHRRCFDSCPRRSCLWATLSDTFSTRWGARTSHRRQSQEGSSSQLRAQLSPRLCHRRRSCTINASRIGCDNHVPPELGP